MSDFPCPKNNHILAVAPVKWNERRLAPPHYVAVSASVLSSFFCALRNVSIEGKPVKQTFGLSKVSPCEISGPAAGSLPACSDNQTTRQHCNNAYVVHDIGCCAGTDADSDHEDPD